MALLNEEILQDVTKMLANLPNTTRLVVFTKAEDCDYCEQIVQLVMEVANTSEKVTMEVYDFNKDEEKAAEYNIDKAPAIAIVGQKDYGVRFFGLPSGYEFSTLLHGIQSVSKGSSGLDAKTKTFLADLDRPAHIQVFVTPTCPYCPRSATMAIDMAIETEHVRGDIIEAAEFQELSNHYNVMGVPLNIVNETQRLEGAAPAEMVVNAIKTSLS